MLTSVFDVCHQNIWLFNHIQKQKNTGSHVIVGMKHTACYEEFEEGKFQDHISIKHGFETRLQSEYVASLERRIMALEDKR